MFKFFERKWGLIKQKVKFTPLYGYDVKKVRRETKIKNKSAKSFEKNQKQERRKESKKVFVK